MIYETKEEFRIIVYLIGYGIFLISSYDTMYYFIKNINKWIKRFILLSYMVSMLLFSYEFSYQLASGYIPIHFVLFLIIGIIIYILMRKIYIEGLSIFKDIYIKLRQPVIKTLVFLFYPRMIIKLIKGIFLTIKGSFKRFFNALLEKNKKME
ncbi:MAG: hypothetical protein IJX78_03925 [Bacilli bacterium]|nr:hypothetical protein [Bacilli bacterium]